MMASNYWPTSSSQGDDNVQPYGSTNVNTAIVKARNHEDVDIQLQDFKGANFKEPFLQETSAYRLSEKKAAVRPTSLHSLLSSPTSDQRTTPLETSFVQHESWIKHPKVREHWRIVLASALLSLLGIALILIGIGIAVTPERGYHCLIFGIIGLLCIIPGGYHFVYIYCAALGKPGFEFENLPVLR